MYTIRQRQCRKQCWQWKVSECSILQNDLILVFLTGCSLCPVLTSYPEQDKSAHLQHKFATVITFCQRLHFPWPVLRTRKTLLWESSSSNKQIDTKPMNEIRILKSWTLSILDTSIRECEMFSPSTLLDKPLQILIIIKSNGSYLVYLSMKTLSRLLTEVKPEHHMRKKSDLTDFEHCMVVGTRRAGDLLGFSHISISRVLKNCPKKGKYPWVKMPYWF